MTPTCYHHVGVMQYDLDYKNFYFFNGKRHKKGPSKKLDRPSDIYSFLKIYTSFSANKYSAICTAFKAAPFLIWSPTTQNARPFGLVKSLRIRPT